jgi:hypothetical protein
MKKKKKKKKNKPWGVDVYRHSHSHSLVFPFSDPQGTASQCSGALGIVAGAI